MANINANSDKRVFDYDSEDSDDSNASKYEIARRVAEDAWVSKRSPEWTELESSVLLENWGSKLLERDYKNLRGEAWNDVAKKVSEASKFQRTKTNCRNRLDTLKKKYKKEKAMLAKNEGSASTWVHFDIMDMIMCPNTNKGKKGGPSVKNSEVRLVIASSSDGLTNSLGGNSESEKEENDIFVEKGQGSVNLEVNLISASSSDEKTNSLGRNSETENEEHRNVVEKGHGLVNSEVALSSNNSSDERTNTHRGNSETEKEDDENVVEKGQGVVNSEVRLSSAKLSGEKTNNLGKENENFIEKEHEVHLISISSSDEKTNSLKGNSEPEKEENDVFVEVNNVDENADMDGPPRKKARTGKETRVEDILKLFADSLDKFTNLYEKVEKNKSNQLVEMEKKKMEFKREMMLQKAEFKKKAQIEIAKMNGADIEDTNDLSLSNNSSEI